MKTWWTKGNLIRYTKGAERSSRGWYLESVRQTDQGSFCVPQNVTVEIRVRRTVN